MLLPSTFSKKQIHSYNMVSKKVGRLHAYYLLKKQNKITTRFNSKMSLFVCCEWVCSCSSRKGSENNFCHRNGNAHSNMANPI